MGEIVIVESRDECPDTLESYYGKCVVRPKDFIPNNAQTNAQYFAELLQIGRNTAIGATILAAIENSNARIYLIPVLATDIESHFDPAVPAVIYNFATTGYIASADPQPMRRSILLFHELGHVRQWIERRMWFENHSTKQHFIDGYFQVIENDNLVVHEWPMCQQLGVPSRMCYTDFFNNREDALKRFVETTKAATTIQAIVRGRQARVAYLKLLSESK